MAADLLRGVEELGYPDGPLLDRLVESTEWLQLRAGQRVFSEGDPADGMYILFEGRLRFAIESSPVAQAQFDVEAVAVFGEGALLTGGGRSRTAVVVIDALLARIPPHMFDETLRHSPDVAVEIARRIAMRTVFPTADTRRRDIADSPDRAGVTIAPGGATRAAAIGGYASAGPGGRRDRRRLG